MNDYMDKYIIWFLIEENGKPYSRSNHRPKIKRHYQGLKFHELRHTHITL